MALPPSLDEARRRELADFLRSRREQITPGSRGLPVSPRRRARGLLREEVAQLSGTSSTWYAWIEQAREVQASPDVLHRVGDVLALSAVERRRLLQLGRPDLYPLDNLCHAPEPGLLRTLAGLAPHPAYLLDRDWTIVAWNPPADALLGLGAAAQRNLIALLFTDWGERFAEVDRVRAAAVAQFRANRAPGCPLAAELRATNPEFARLWAAGAVSAPALWRKVVLTSAGPRTFDTVSLSTGDALPGGFMTMYTEVKA